jgi:magnesium transporter
MSLVKSVGKQKVNLEFNKDFINLFSEKIKSKDVAFINQTLADLHSADVANLIENLDTDTRNKLIEIEAFNIEPEIFIELNESVQSEVLLLISPESIAKILHKLESDNALQILENLEENKKKKSFRQTFPTRQVSSRRRS